MHGEGDHRVSSTLETSEAGRVDDEIARFLADDGATYVPADGLARPWRLDPEPLVIGADEWAPLQVGLAQRAELLNAMLADLYGPRRLLAAGILPASLVYAHAGYLRPLMRAAASDPTPLLLTATDLARDADGGWQVLADRVQAPSGLGYALENRRVISQVLPDRYRAHDVHSLAPSYAALRATLLDAAGVRDGDSPRVAVLSPGPQSETAYEQGRLAGVLGFPLVQGEDLLMRDGWIWFKPAGWPKRPATERVDVILRRVDADWCDPLEMRGQSRLGVAGLTQAVRRGRVRVVNGLGAGVLENPGLAPFLPAACQELLGEQLLLPSAPTWWCGDPEARSTVLERLDDPSLVVREIDAPAAPALPPDRLRAAIRSAPHRFAAQAPPADPVVLRAFALRFGGAYRPIAGGLATVVAAGSDDAPLTRDVWVRKASPADPDQGLADITIDDAADAAPVPSPSALEDMFWVGRYAERAEDLLRIVLTLEPDLDERDLPDDVDELAAEPVTAIGARALRRLLHRLAGTASAAIADDLRSLLLDARRQGSAAQSLRGLRTAAEGVRDQLSADTWRVFANLDRAQRSLRASTLPHRTAETAGRMLTAVLSLQGVTANMVRDAGWHMIEAGRGIERALQVCALLTETTGRVRARRAERDVLSAALRAAESTITYRRRHRGAPAAAGVLELLLADGDNPRSLACAVAELRCHLAALPASTGATRPERLADLLAASIAEIDVAELASADPTGTVRPGVLVLLEDVSGRLEQLSDAVHELHFSGGLPPLALSELSLIEEAG